MSSMMATPMQIVLAFAVVVHADALVERNKIAPLQSPASLPGHGMAPTMDAATTQLLNPNPHSPAENRSINNFYKMKHGMAPTMDAATAGMATRIARGQPKVLSPAAMKAKQFRRLRQELRQQRKRRELVKQKLEGLKDLERQHLVTKSKIEAHQPKTANRNAKTYVDAALERVAYDIADTKKEVRIVDAAIQKLQVRKVFILGNIRKIKIKDDLIVKKLNEDKKEEANLANLIAMESTLKKGVDEHRTVHVGALRTKVANGRNIQEDLKAQLMMTMEQKKLLMWKLTNEQKTESWAEVDKRALEKKVAACQARVQQLSAELNMQKTQVGEKSQQFDQLKLDHTKAEQELDQASQELQTYHNKYDVKKAEALRLKTQNRVLERQRKQEKAAADAKHAEQKRTIQELEAQKAKAEADRLAAAAEAEQTATKLQNIAMKKQDLQDQTMKLASNLAKEQNQHRADKTIAAQQHIQDEQNAKQKVEAVKRDADAKLAREKQAAADKLRIEKAEANAEAETLKRKVEAEKAKRREAALKATIVQNSIQNKLTDVQNAAKAAADGAAQSMLDAQKTRLANQAADEARIKIIAAEKAKAEADAEAARARHQAEVDSHTTTSHPPIWTGLRGGGTIPPSTMLHEQVPTPMPATTDPEAEAQQDADEQQEELEDAEMSQAGVEQYANNEDDEQTTGFLAVKKKMSKVAVLAVKKKISKVAVKL